MVNKNNIKNKGVYLTVEPTPECREWLVSIIERLQLDAPIDLSKLHVTLVYSEGQEVPDYEPEKTGVFKAEASHFDFFGENSDCLVVVLKSEDLKEKHIQLLEKGFGHSRDDYNPHITLSYDYRGGVIDNKILELAGSKKLEFQNESIRQINTVRDKIPRPRSRKP